MFDKMKLTTPPQSGASQGLVRPGKNLAGLPPRVIFIFS
jgi:hypothetical protein